ncbi:MAG TPA: hypothetical protein VF309_03755 [Usitatibacter sp.]
MRNILATTTAAFAFAFACGSATAAPMTKDEYKAAKKKILADYTVERQKCGSRGGNALALCVAHAHGERDVAKAELEAQYKPSARTNYNAAIARSKSAYTIARDECNEHSGPEKKACLKEAVDVRKAAEADALAKRTAQRAEEAAKH